MFDSIQRMRHKVRTSFGDSTVTYGGTDKGKIWKLPPQGVLQGNGSGPAIWAILSSIIFAILKQTGFQNTFASPIRHVSLELAGFAYVDDSDLIQVEDSVEKVVDNMRKQLKTWIDAIGVTGGVLAPHKCWWYLVMFKYQLGQWRACLPRGDFRLWITSNRNEKVEVTRLEPADGNNMLGVYLAPDGNNKQQVQYLRDKAQHWADSITSHYTNREEVWTALHRTIPFAMSYSLPASTLSEEECKFIMAPIHKIGLPKTGITATIPAAIRSGPIRRGGLGLLNAYNHMGASQKGSEICSNTILDQTPLYVHYHQ
jgi:hypothetical protein